MRFIREFLASYRMASALFSRQSPDAVLTMGGFGSVAPFFAAKRFGAIPFLHEANAVAGRANRFIGRFVKIAFVGFQCAAAVFKHPKVLVIGTPVRGFIKTANPEASKGKLGLLPGLPAFLVMGGSQGATGINEAMMKALPIMAENAPEVQWIHLTGLKDARRVGLVYERLGLRAFVEPFSTRMDVVLDAATGAVSRSGASCLAEFAAMRIPSVLIPYPFATDNHQLRNASVFSENGAAMVLEQNCAKPETLSRLILDIVRNNSTRERMQSALTERQSPNAARHIASTIFETIQSRCA
jgi:UDP-N-acetylglucosamine--N-acetylmuramyl-(pentapeptide) pyrophosphoryl-undecaprenol N-acetylglucosamine transferase